MQTVTITDGPLSIEELLAVVDGSRVEVAPGGESAPQIEAGQPVTFSGTLRPVPADPAGAFGLTPGDGLDQLTEQGHYLEVTDVTETP